MLPKEITKSSVSKLANVRRNFVYQLNRRVLEILKRQAKIELYAAPADRDNNDASSIVSTGATLCAFRGRVKVDRSIFSTIEDRNWSHAFQRNDQSNGIVAFSPEIIVGP